MAYVDKLFDTWKVTLACQVNERQIQQMNFHLKIMAAGVFDTRGDVLDAINVQYGTLINPLMSQRSFYLGGKMSYTFQDPPPVPVVKPMNQQGSGDIHPLPTAARPLIKILTPYAGPGFRGRVFAFTPGAACVDTEGHPSSNISAGWVSILGTFIAGFTVGGSTWQLCVRHPKLKSDPIPEDDPTMASSVKAANLFGTQRRAGDFGAADEAPW